MLWLVLSTNVDLNNLLQNEEWIVSLDFVVGLVEATLLNFIVILWIDWEKAKDDALKRTQDKKESEEDTELITNHVVVTSDNELNVFDERDDKKEND